MFGFVTFDSHPLPFSFISFCPSIHFERQNLVTSVRATMEDAQLLPKENARQWRHYDDPVVSNKPYFICVNQDEDDDEFLRDEEIIRAANHVFSTEDEVQRFRFRR